MSNLDDNIKRLVLTVAPNQKYPIVKLDIVVNEIKKAFREAGWKES